MARHFLSPSSITMYLRCPRKYFLRYIRKLTPKSSIHLVRGKAVHEAIAKLTGEFSVRKSDLPSMQLLLKEYFDEAWAQYNQEMNGLHLSKEEVKTYYEESLVMLSSWLEQHTKFVNSGVSCTDREMKLFSQTHNVMGIIDAIYQKNGKVSIIDYKTGKSDEITEDIKIQMAIYALLYRENRGVLPDMISIA